MTAKAPTTDRPALRTDLRARPGRLTSPPTSAGLVGVDAVRAAWTSVEGAAAYTSLSETTIRRAVWSGDLQASRVGSRLAFAFRELDRWLNSHAVGGAR